MTTPAPFIPWSRAWRDAHLGDRGFYRAHSPRDHFATEIGGDVIVAALTELLHQVDARLSHPPGIEVVDIGPGEGELLAGILARAGDDLADRLHCSGVDVRERPAALDERIEWVHGVAPQVLARRWPEGITGMIIAHEWLDDLPVDVVALNPDGDLREVLVDPRTGDELLASELPPDSAQQEWLHRWWWPVHDRAEIGLLRDDAWRAVCSTLRAGTALAIDYGHIRDVRSAERFTAGTMTGFRAGETCWPIPDGSMNITAHVAMDSLAHATTPPGRLLHQREALAELLPDAPLPTAELARADPAEYVRELQEASARGAIERRSLDVWWVQFDLP